MKKNIYMAIAALSLAVSVGADEVQFSQLPRKAQQTINKYLNGGMVQDIDQKTINGRTIYEVEVRREGRNRHLKVDSDGKLLAATAPGNISADVDTDDGGAFDKNDGKILGVFDNPNDDKGVEAEARVGDNEVAVDADIDADVDVDKPRDRGITEDVFDKNDGKILDVVPAPSKNDGAKVEGEVDIDTDDDKRVEAEVDLDDDKEVAVEANAGEDKGIFRNDDGKILGIPLPGRDADDAVTAEVEVDSDKDHVTTDVDGGLDTDKNDGRILGVPKRGFETLSLNEVPPVVRETIRREAGGYKIAEIEKATEAGRMVYEVDIERDGKNRELHIAADGTILKDTDRGAVGAPATIERGADRD